MRHAKDPDAAQKAVAAFHAGIVPFQCRLGRRGEHGVEPGGVCAIQGHDVLWIDPVEFAFTHFANTTVFNLYAIRCGAAADTAISV